MRRILFTFEPHDTRSARPEGDIRTPPLVQLLARPDRSGVLDEDEVLYIEDWDGDGWFIPASELRARLNNGLKDI